MGETEDFDLMEMHEVNFIETLFMHYLNLMDSLLNPLLGKQLERTTAVSTTIITLNDLFLDVNDVIGLRWYEVRTHRTQNRKWDGVGFSVKDKKLTPILIEFSGGIKFNNTDQKEENDVNKLASACIESIEYTTAATDLGVSQANRGDKNRPIFVTINGWPTENVCREKNSRTKIHHFVPFLVTKIHHFVPFLVTKMGIFVAPVCLRNTLSQNLLSDFMFIIII
ncbi:hypothetical protein EDC94DRAFT_681733 [Helicostylum pulchrum]|nr:hypothetical protein EDC94DRAFT_681733 [Helicostylum pulchrum]